MSLIASLALSFTLVPVLFKYLMRAAADAHEQDAINPIAPKPQAQSFQCDPPWFRSRVLTRFREAYRNSVAWASRTHG